jgi:hypothetical protein
MQHSDRAEMARILVALAELKPGGKITPEALDMWFGALTDWTIAEFRQAAQRLTLTEQFFPNPWHFQQLRQAANRVTPGEAWALALEHVRKGHHRDGPAAPADVDRAVRAIGGWQIIGHATDEDLRFLERRFTANYSEIREATDVREELPALARDNPVKALLAGMRRK